MTARKHKALGKGLGALFGNSKTISGGEASLQDADTNLVNPDNVDSPATMEASGAAEKQGDTKNTGKGRTSIDEPVAEAIGKGQPEGLNSISGKGTEGSEGKKKAPKESISEKSMGITVPVAIHLDHGHYEDVFECI